MIITTYKNNDRLMYVVGATKAEFLKEIRDIIPDSFLLVPGVGAQGGDLHAVCKNGMNDQVGLLINSSRGIIYAGKDENFAAAARDCALLEVLFDDSEDPSESQLSTAVVTPHSLLSSIHLA